MLQKQALPINFSSGLNLKDDPFQVAPGSFLALNNMIFTTGKRLTKRNGFKNITNLPNSLQSTLTTLNGNLIATGSNLYAFSEDTNQWLNQGTVQPVQLNTLPLIRVSTSQSSPDSATANNGFVCLVYMDNGQAYYQISDSATGQQIVQRTTLPATAVFPRVFTLGNYFIITMLDTVSASTHLQYIAIPISVPTSPRPIADFATNVNALTSGYDGMVVSGTNKLYIAYEGSGSTVKLSYLTSALAVGTGGSIASSAANLMTVSSDLDTSRVFISFWDSSSTNAFSAAFDFSLTQRMAKTQILTGVAMNEITSSSQDGVTTVLYQVHNTYGYDSSIRTDYVSKVACTLPVSGVGTGTAGSPTVVLRSVGLASKSFINNSTIYCLVEYGDTAQSTPADDSNQPTYFLIDSNGNIYMRLAYSNGGGYAKTQVLPSISLYNGDYNVAYLINDFLATVNKTTDPNDPATPANAIYTQNGVSLAIFGLNTNQQHSSEIAGCLNLTGGMLWEYDGVKPVENNFQVWPENVEVTTATGSGAIAAGTYYYQFCYEWTNNQGNLERSAPSIPVSIVTTTSSSTNTIYVPTDRLTYKVAPNPIRIVGYRWSVAQEVYYQFTSLTSPTLNDTTVDYVTFTDALSDAEILGNVILYTTGGVIEDIGAPASIDSALFDNRLWLIDAEDQNLLWYSKQVIQNVPVEMSDLLTYYVAPTTSAQGSTGPAKAIYPMDDKLIVFKQDAAYYINGTGPDNTGSNSQYSQPIFITASVGCANPNSIVLMPNGLMFQSDKGIWLLGRDLSTNYIGAPVEAYNSSTVMSATAVPGTTQVRFVLNSGVTLVYDYFYGQWATHSNVLAISSILYQNSHTYLNSIGQVFQESPGLYLDGTVPVLMNLTTSWINLAGVQGFERFYFANLLGLYFTPFKLACTLSYNYNPSAIQSIIVTPDNFTPAYGEEPGFYGSGAAYGADSDPMGGSTMNIFSARLFPSTQKCQSFQVSIEEVYDSEFGVQPGQGLTLSGLALIVGLKKGYRTQSAVKSFG